MRHRREISDVTDVEFDKFAAALNHMKSTGVWEMVAKVHAASERQHFQTHGDPKTFLPWHRKFIVEVENRLQMAGKATGLSDVEACSMTIPYWNWLLDSSDFTNAIVWGNDRLGALNNDVQSGTIDEQMCVADGKFGSGAAAVAAGSEFGKPGSTNPFQQETYRPPGCTTFWGPNACTSSLAAHNRGSGSDCIFRKGGGLRSTLNYVQVVTALREHEAYAGIDKYEDMANYLERQIHNDLHGSVGGNRFIDWSRMWGHMTSFYSPYDPVFFMHHGFMDFLWGQWQDAHVSAPWRDADVDENGQTVHQLNNLLWDGNADFFPISDVALAMDIKDDEPSTVREENVCVKYHERRSNHVCNNDPAHPDKWTDIQQCMADLVSYEKLHAVPRIRHNTEVGDVCDPLNELHFDNDRMWLETMVQAGMMDASKIDEVLAWERDQLEVIENTTETIAVDDASTSDCDKALCFSTTKMLQICQDCRAQGWSLTCHCDTSQLSTSCWESRT
jgi:hypothetical protein